MRLCRERIPTVMHEEPFICCFGLLLFLFGFRKLKHFLIAFLTPILLLIGYIIVDGGAGEMYEILTSRHLRTRSAATQVE